MTSTTSSFSNDSSYCLLSSLEVLDDEGNFVRKADMFSKRTIKQKVTVLSVDTASEAYALSLAEKAKVDMPYMMELTGKTEQEITDDLRGVIFRNPLHTEGDEATAKFLPADEYLSGNVREKLAAARHSAELYPLDFDENVKALEAVQPVDLTASEISVRLGATWLPPEIVEQFMFRLLDTPRWSQWNIILYLFGVIPVVWLGLLIAPSMKDGLLGLVQQFGTIMQNPFKIELCEDSVKAVLVLLLAYGIAIGVYLSSDHNYRRREEHGSAKWGMAGSVNKKYANKVKTENKLPLLRSRRSRGHARYGHECQRFCCWR